MIIPAKEARELSEKAVSLVLEEQRREVQEAIDQAINNGSYFCFVSDLHDRLLVELRELGYQLSPTSPATFKLSWSLNEQR